MLISRPVPTSHPPRPGRTRRVLALTTLGLAGLVAGLLAGCGTGISPAINTIAHPDNFAAATGNWKFTTASSAFAGALTISGVSVSGTLHSLTGSCAALSNSFEVVGSIDASGLLTIASTNFAGGKITISGPLSSDRHSLTEPSITVTGGSCSAPSLRASSLAPHDTSAPTAQQYQPLTGNYNGVFTDTAGATLAVAATLSQPTTPDANGVYHLTGYATFPNTPCLSTPVITDSTVTGDSIQATYTDQQTGNTVSGSGTFSPDAQTLTITNWILSGCGSDTGTGLLTRQTN